MTLKGDEKFKEKKLTCDLKNVLRNLVNLHVNS